MPLTRNRRGIRLSCAFVLALAIARLWVPAPLAQAASPVQSQTNQPAGEVFYVAGDGNDAWSGRLAAPDSARRDGPFATLQRARDAVRALKASRGASAPVTVMVRGGKYYLDRTLDLGAADSGTADHPVSYQAYPGEKPILSGGRRVSSWKPYQGKIQVAELPGARGGKWKFRQLFLNGQRQIQARLPNLDPKNPMYGGWLFMVGPAEPESKVSFKYKPGTFERRWAKPSEAEVVFYQWTGQWMSTVPVRSVDEKNQVITLVRPGAQFDVAPWYQPVPLLPNNPFYITNVLEELDQPGEWCLDTEAGLLYFWPPEGALRSSDEVVVPLLPTLVDIHGASWVRFSGFTFTETMDGDNYHREGLEGTGAMYPQAGWQYGGEALHMKDAAHCTIEHNRFDAVGTNAIYLEGRNERNVIQYNEIGHAGAIGIALLGTRFKHPVYNRISDNYIHHVGALNKYVAGVFAGMSNGNIISHNRIEYVPHHAINLSNNPAGRNIVEYNLIRFACLQINDTGAINLWMEQPASQDAQRDGHIIRFNYISDTFTFQAANGKLDASGWSNGIYLDNYSSNSTVYGNIIVRCRNGIQIHAGRNNLIENNIIADCVTNLSLIDAVSFGSYAFWKDMRGFYTANHVMRNIFYQTATASRRSSVGDIDPVAIQIASRRLDTRPLYSLYIGWTDETLAQCDHNVLFQGADGKYSIQDSRKVEEREKVTALDQWRKLGYDRESVIADPLFVDPSRDDYRLRPDSPALKLGFIPIDVRAIGPRSGPASGSLVGADNAQPR